MTPKETAMQRFKAGECILCRTKKGPFTRGLCKTQHKRFTRAVAKMNDEQREKFETELIERGMLLESEQGKRRETQSDEFQSVANEMFGPPSHPPKKIRRIVGKMKRRAHQLTDDGK